MNYLNYILIGLLLLYTVLDSVLVKRYEKKIKKLTDDNKKLMKMLQNFEVK